LPYLSQRRTRKLRQANEQCRDPGHLAGKRERTSSTPAKPQPFVAMCSWELRKEEVGVSRHLQFCQQSRIEMALLAFPEKRLHLLVRPAPTGDAD
jgi:hypothetical protein